MDGGLVQSGKRHEAPSPELKFASGFRGLQFGLLQFGLGVTVSISRYGVRARNRRISGFARFPRTGALALALVCATTPVAMAGAKIPNKAKPAVQHAPAEPFGSIPRGPLQIIISIDQQKLHLYSDGTEVAETLVATGVPEHPTPLGAFSVIQKSLLHHSNIYSGAPMPFMQRITWSGVAIHEGVNLGHPASHGCIRMSHDFAARLWVLTRPGARVVIARAELRPEEIADPHLFVRVEKSAAPDGSKSDKAAQSAGPGQTTEIAEQKKDAPAADASAGAANATSAADEKPNHSAGGATAVMASTEAAMPIPVPSKSIYIGHASKAPISIFISRKEKRLYVRQDFLPLFDVAITIEQPEQPIGTHVFTALDYLPDRSGFRWNVISLPGDRMSLRQSAGKDDRSAKASRGDERAGKLQVDSPPPQRPQQALARVEVPQDAAAQISQLIVPGSSLIISDEGLGEETGEGTDFVVVTPIVRPQRFDYARAPVQRAPRMYSDAPPVYAPVYRQVYRPMYAPPYQGPAPYLPSD